MTWGVFNKIAKGAKDTFNFVKDKAIPTGKKVVDFGKKAVEIAKPFLEGTKWGGYIDKAEKISEWSGDVLDYADDFTDAVGSGNMERTADLYKKRGQLKPRYN